MVYLCSECLQLTAVCLLNGTIQCACAIIPTCTFERCQAVKQTCQSTGTRKRCIFKGLRWGVRHRSTRGVLAYHTVQILSFILANDTFNSDQNNGLCNVLHTDILIWINIEGILTTGQKEKQQERKHCNAITSRPSTSCYTDMSEVRVTLHDAIPSAVNAVMLSRSQ